MKNEFNEKEIVKKAQAGDKSALAILVSEYQSRIYHLGLRLLGQEQDAEDMLQQTFLMMIENIKQFQGKSSFYTWLYRIALNIGLRKMQSKPNKYEHVPIDDPDVERIHSEHLNEWPKFDFAHISNKVFREKLETSLLELPEKYRTTFILRDLHGLSTMEAAGILQISESNAKIRLMRARNFLKTKLEKIVQQEELL